MAARVRPSSRPALAGAVIALALLVVSCSDGVSQPRQERAATTTTSKPEPPADPRLVELADQIGCSATKQSERGHELTGALLCAIDDETTTRIHIFDAPDRPSVERRFVAAIGDSPKGGVECNGDTYQFVVLGEDWLVATTDRVVAGNLIVGLQADFVEPDGEPPSTSEARDACR
jgi:hypothetical protein